MQDPPLVSVIMPAYNAEKYIGAAIQSILNQSYHNWELLIVNDGSQDATEQVIMDFQDGRIHYFKQENKGVSAARNVALNHMKGAYFCFLDADDAYPEKSIEARLLIFEEDAAIEFVDGSIELKDAKLEITKSVKTHSYEGNPHNLLARLDDRCFFGPSWMIRCQPEKTYTLVEGMTHGEDLYFYISISQTGKYKATSEVVLHYRTENASAMQNLEGLENGYAYLFNKVFALESISTKNKQYLRRRIIRIMFLSYLRKKQFFAAIKVIFRFFFFMKTILIK